MLLADLAMNKRSNISTHTAGACMHKKWVSTPKWIKNVLLLQLVYEARGIIITFCFFFEISFYGVAPHGLELTAILLSLSSLSAGLVCMHHHSWQNKLKYQLDVVAYTYLPRYLGGGKRITWYWEFKAGLGNTVETFSQRQQINGKQERYSSVVEGLPSVRSVVRRGG